MIHTASLLILGYRRERDLDWDRQSFSDLMAKQREQSQAANQFKVDLLKQLHLSERSTFVGYDKEQASGVLLL